MENKTPQYDSRTQLQVAAAGKQAKMLSEQGRYAEALDACLQVAHAYPKVANAWGDAASNCAHLGRWQDAIRYAQTALACDGNSLTIYDALAHAHGFLGQWDEARRYGLQALNMRASRFGSEPPIPLPKPGPMPPLPCAQTRGRNVIAFSLFGGNSKYCEPAILNVQEQPQIYPDWVCRFYVDDSVPANVIDRLRAGGGQIVLVHDPEVKWPGPMWRFLALDDPQVDRVLFRDADSVISRREAEAVDEWLASGKRFHIMRDFCTHTELMLAGLWGVVNGSLPPLEQLMQRFMSAPLESVHFADQFFLRQYVWPYARTSLMQHDSVFGFMDGVPFPGGERPKDFHVGHVESFPSFTATVSLPEGSKVVWELYMTETPKDGSPPREKLICAYPGVVSNGAVKAHLPERYFRRFQQVPARININPVDSATA